MLVLGYIVGSLEIEGMSVDEAASVGIAVGSVKTDGMIQLGGSDGINEADGSILPTCGL